jgi:hypothetical protein
MEREKVMTNKLKVKITKALINKDKTLITKTFKFAETDIKKLQRIATLKKATQTRVLRELIRLAYAGLFMPEMKQLNEFYNTLINERTELKVKEPKRKVYK